VLPFVFLDETKLGPFHAFGLCVALAFFAFDWAIMKQAVRKGFDRADFRVLTLWVLGGGTLSAWMVDAIFYHPPGRSVVSTLFAFQGFSSTGAFIGAFLGGVVWRYLWIGKKDGKLRIAKREKPMALLPPADVFVSTWPIAFALGRLGCAITHDHPGVTVPKGTLGSLFAVAWPLGPEDGTDHVLGPIHVVTGGSTARFDLGLLDVFLLSAIAIGFMFTWKKELRTGTYVILGTLIYGPIRFCFDFLRLSDGPAGDLRHAGLTFAQYFCIAIIALGLTLFVRRRLAAAPAVSAKEGPAPTRVAEAGESGASADGGDEARSA
jgi:phosphatidylglycerol---prolipoprotein diacylglyceryl transferase